MYDKIILYFFSTKEKKYNNKKKSQKQNAINCTKSKLFMQGISNTLLGCYGVNYIQVSQFAL